MNNDIWNEAPLRKPSPATPVDGEILREIYQDFSLGDRVRCRCETAAPVEEFPRLQREQAMSGPISSLMLDYYYPGEAWRLLVTRRCEFTECDAIKQRQRCEPADHCPKGFDFAEAIEVG